MELGRAIVKELNLDPGVDTLSRWMAHHIAELMTDVETSKGEKRKSTSETCFNTILALWNHRNVLPDGSRPFAKLEPILKALESLEPSSDSPRYYRSFWDQFDEINLNDEMKNWINTSKIVDKAAKELIRYCLTKATQPILIDSKPWIDIIKDVGLDNEIELTIFQLMSGESDQDQHSKMTQKERQSLENRINMLRILNETATLLELELKEQLHGLLQNSIETHPE